ncbi:DNA cytosine methyltransferase [Mesorhizobium sp. B2-2-4]|uniref:DNA cytosine methyltransferase n=1 Tax=unclassified Mesorhizobium TaxID=325217 RepID=UPI0011293DA1|nr:MULTISPECIES: DNA cytosine methyltransferase [unclassified Mesorhizobium]TPM61111.1 DNA cytosine methyltransferase [Mesorhizobium sp. B2-2-4]TPM70542.1 DNA cytosine methyltransferase [Mesorhizobium sp. B2-2-1]TPN70395.1 DNA cytosine methyltransferase [Mesorhizobium sp. B1-1-3]
MSYRIIDLFCGAGGMTLGFVDPRYGGGFVSVLGLDNDESATRTHSINFPGESICANIEEWVATSDIPKADIVVGGPPCQGFSLLNKARSGDARRALWEPYLDVVKASGARIFVMENVAELFRSPELIDIRARANELGFETIAAVLNTADYGVPQTRKRTIVIGWDRKRLPHGVEMPRQSHFDPNGKEKGAAGLAPWETVRQALKGLPAKTIGTEIGRKAPLDLHFGRTPTEKSEKRYRAVPPGGNRFDLFKNAPELTPDCWIRKTSGGTDLFGRLWWDRPSVTIRTEFFKPEKGRYLHPEAHRPISHREAARLMTFPDDFKFAGNKTDVARQIGNAVPPVFAGRISSVVKDALDRLERASTARPRKTHEFA